MAKMRQNSHLAASCEWNRKAENSIFKYDEKIHEFDFFPPKAAETGHW